MFKVMISQVIKNEVVGKTVLVEDFDDINKAINAAKRYSRVYDRQAYQIREYGAGKSHIISFDEHDTGTIVKEVV